MIKSFEVVVLGAGDVGLSVAFKAAASGARVALIDRGPVGGTCVNFGCVPSKTLIQTADRIAEIRESGRLGISVSVKGVDFPAIMRRVRHITAEGRKGIQRALEESDPIAFYAGEGHFVDPHHLDVGPERLKGKKIFIATGSRPNIPPLAGLMKVPFLTNENVLTLDQQPESLIIIGGGYVGLEYAHFFSALGTQVSIIHRHSNFVPHEEPEMAEALKESLGKKATLYLKAAPLEVKRIERGVGVVVQDLLSGEKKEVTAEKLFLSTGRQSNADVLHLEKAGLLVDQRHFIKVDDTLQTSQKHIWALGDAVGKAMFTHAGDHEAEIAWHNATQRKKRIMAFNGVPHAIFTRPQIASIGLTEEAARKDYEVLVGRAFYADTVMGEAMGEEKGFAKAVVEKGSERILGFHILGPQAALLIQEVVNTVLNGGTVKDLTGPMHIFPALSNLIPEVFSRLE
jgi:mycothione reductase